MPAIRKHEPRRVIELIQTVEKALQDLIDFGDTEVIKSPLVTKLTDGKLPRVSKNAFFMLRIRKILWYQAIGVTAPWCFFNLRSPYISNRSN